MNTEINGDNLEWYESGWRASIAGAICTAVLELLAEWHDRNYAAIMEDV